MKHIIPFLLLISVIALPSRGADDVVSSPSLTLEGAKKVGDAAEAAAIRLGAPGGAIAVVDSAGHLLYFVRRVGTFLGSPNISIGKAKTAAQFKKPTRDFEEIIAKGRFAMTALPDFTPLQGGVPIYVNDQIVGAIGVSGAKTAQQDEEIAQAGALAFATEKR